MRNNKALWNNYWLIVVTGGFSAVEAGRFISLSSYGQWAEKPGAKIAVIPAGCRVSPLQETPHPGITGLSSINRKNNSAD